AQLRPTQRILFGESDESVIGRGNLWQAFDWDIQSASEIVVPGARALVQKSGTGSHRQTRRRLAEQPEHEIVRERQPALCRCKNTGAFFTQPEKLGGPVAGMKAATSTRVNLGFAETRTELFGSLCCARFGPTKNRRRCLSFRVDANQTVPETGDRYQLDPCACLIRPGKERVDGARDLLDQLVRIQLIEIDEGRQDPI